MTNITKKQASIALVVVALSAIMVAGTIVSSADNAFAHRHHHHHHHHHGGHHSSIHQSISQHSEQSQHSTVLSAGANSPISGSGNNFASSLNANSGGNAGANN